MAPGGEENAADIGGENYEVMAADSEIANSAPPQDEGEDYMAMEDDTPQVEQEDYEEPGQAEEGTKQDEDYEMPGAEDSTNYEGTCMHKI